MVHVYLMSVGLRGIWAVYGKLYMCTSCQLDCVWYELRMVNGTCVPHVSGIAWDMHFCMLTQCIWCTWGIFSISFHYLVHVGNTFHPLFPECAGWCTRSHFFLWWKGTVQPPLPDRFTNVWLKLTVDPPYYSYLWIPHVLIKFKKWTVDPPQYD